MNDKIMDSTIYFKNAPEDKMSDYEVGLRIKETFFVKLSDTVETLLLMQYVYLGYLGEDSWTRKSLNWLHISNSV